MNQETIESDVDELTLDQLREKDELTPDEAAKLVALETEERDKVLDGLAKKVTELFARRSDARSTKESEWVRCQNLYNSPLLQSNPTDPDAFFGTSGNNKRRPEANIVRTKCDTAISVSYSMQFAAGEKNWDLFPPADNEDPIIPAKCKAMEKKIEAQLDACNYAMQARLAMEDRVIYGTGVLKGPVNTGKQRVRYVQSGDQWITEVRTDYTPSIEHVPLWRFYPDVSVSEFDDSNDVIQLHTWTPLELSQYKDHPGFNGAAIRYILNPENGLTPEAYNDASLHLKGDIWNRHPYLIKKKKYAVLEYHGPITYDELNKLGICPTYESPTAEYYGEVWVCAGKVIRIEIENIEGFSETPYAVSVWKRDPGSIFGFGHPLLLSDAQQVLTQAYHMILDNAALTAMPQVAVYKKHIQPIDGNWNIQPGKVWYMTDPTKKVDDAIKFINATNNISNIMPVMELARSFADEESATPQTAAGLNSPQTMDSATGQMLMQHASTTLLDFQSEEWDDRVTEKVIRRMYAWNMQYSPDPNIKGDYVIDVKSSSEYKNKQMYIRDLERLSMETAQNPALQFIVNQTALQRARLQLMNIPDNKIIYSDEESAQLEQQAQQSQQPDPKMLELELKKAELDLKAKEYELRQRQLEFELQQAQQRELWDYEEKMGSNQARYAEAQARVLEAQTNHQIELLKLAQKGELEAAKIANSKEATQLAMDTQVFVAGMQQQTKQKDQDNTRMELDLKAQLGTGI